ncbi:MAG: hypothetical protein ACKN9V_01465, partial [Pseudomonadota bacterium]
MKLTLFLGLLILASCASLKPVENQLSKDLSREDFLKEQQLREDALGAVTGKLQVRYSVKRGSFMGAAKFVKTDRESRFEVSDPMGRTRYWLIGDLEGILAYYETDQVAYTAGEGGKKYFEEFFGMRLTWKEIENIWMGILPRKWRENLEEKWMYDTGIYRGLIRQENKEPIHLEISAKTRQVNRIQMKRGVQEVQIVFSDFDACCAYERGDSILGHSVEIKLPDPSEKIGLEWEELSILEQAPNPVLFSRKLLGRVKMINLDKQGKR